MDEIILVDKPAGITSFDVIRILRKQLGVRKMGHAGTLDPLATGLMIIGVGAGTKRLTDYLKLDKEYVTEVLLGRQTTTGDLEGEVVAETEVKETISESTISEALKAMIGELTLPVSAYSAIKRDGVPMYKRARQAALIGEVITDVPVRLMRVDQAKLISTNTIIYDSKQFQVVTVRFSVGSGTYIRSLGEELGRRLEYPATLQLLQRTKIGDFTLEQSKHVDDF